MPEAAIYYELGYDYQVLTEVMAQFGIDSLKLAQLTGRHVDNINARLSGRRTIPVDFFRALYEQTGDIRVLKLVAGRRLVEIKAPPSVTAMQKDSRGQGSKDSSGRAAASSLESSNPHILESSTLKSFPPTPPRLPPAQQLMEHLAEAMERLVGSAGYAHKILTGPIVDDSDHQALANFRADCFCLIGLLGDAATLAERFAASRGGDCQRKKVRK